MSNDKLPGIVADYAGERYYSVDAGAAFLGMSVAWLYETARRLHTPRYNITRYGRMHFYRESDLLALRDAPRPVGG